MANYDGEVRIGTKVDTSQMQRLNIQIEKSVMKVDTLAKKYESLKNQKVPTEAFIDLGSKLHSAQAELQKLIEEENRLTDAGLAMGGQWERIIQKEADAQLKIEAITAEMQKMKEAGTAFTAGDPEQIREAAQNLALGKKELAALVTKQDELIAKQETTARKSRSVSEGLKRIGEVGKKAFAKMNSHAKHSGGLFQTMASRLKGILLSLLIFNWISKGFNAMISGMKKGFKNLVLYSEEYNRSVSALKSANTQLQNSWASAFMPIVQMAIPHMITLINYVTSAANAVAQFTAILSGKPTWIKAVAVQEDYAASLNGTATAAKKAAGALASFDTLEVLNKKDSAGGSSAGSTNPKDMFEEVPVEPIKFDPKEFGQILSNHLADALEEIEWEKIQDSAEKLGRDFANILNGIWENERLAYDLGMSIGEAANTGVRLAYGFIDEHEWEQMGRFLGNIVQTALDTFDTEMAGQTAGKLVNGFADAVNGYFQQYKAGSTGAAIAAFLNSAVDEIDADLVGMAISKLVGGFFTEIGTFFDDVEAAEIGQKVSQAFIKFFTYAGEDGTVGEQIGHALAAVLNAGIDWLLGLI